MECLELSKSYILKEQKTKSSLGHHLIEPQMITSLSTTSRVADHVSRSLSDELAVPAAFFGEGNTMDPSRFENGLFSSSLSDIFDRKLRLPSNSVPLGQSVNSVNSNFGEDEPFESLEEIEAQTIGNLLPDDDDLLSGIIDDIGYIGRSNNGSDIDDDIFYSGGGMELETDDNVCGTKTSEFVASNGQRGGLNRPFANEHPYGSNNLENGAVQGLGSVVRAPLTPLMEATFCGTSSSVPHNLCSPVGIALAGNHTNQASYFDINHSLGQMNVRFQGMPGIVRQSLPDYHNGLTNGVSCNSNTTSTMGISVTSRPSERIDNRHLQNVGSVGFNRHFLDPNEAFGANGSCPLHGHPYVWNNTNTFHHKPTSPMLWPNSSLSINNIPTKPSQIHGIPSAQSTMLNTVLPLHHHVGSAPAVNPSIWGRNHVYARDSMDPPAFHPGSLASLGLSRIPQLHSLEIFSGNICSHAGRNCVDPSIPPAHVASPSTQQRCQMFHGRNPMITMPHSFDGPTDRIRSRRYDINANHSDNKKQYELDIECIIRGEDSRTTLMIKNIPNKYTSKLLLAAIDENHRGTYDFIYLPIDFKNKCNVGYAFINMTNPQHIIPFYQSFNGKKWEKFNSEKVASLAYARIQGKAALIAHFQNSSLMNEDKRCRPILFHTDGPNAGDQEPFPVGNRSRSGRSRTVSGSEEDHQGIPSTTFADGRGSCDAEGSPSGSTRDLE